MKKKTRFPCYWCAMRHALAATVCLPWQTHNSAARTWSRGVIIASRRTGSVPRSTSMCCPATTSFSFFINYTRWIYLDKSMGCTFPRGRDLSSSLVREGQWRRHQVGVSPSSSPRLWTHAVVGPSINYAFVLQQMVWTNRNCRSAQAPLQRATGESVISFSLLFSVCQHSFFCWLYLPSSA